VSYSHSQYKTVIIGTPGSDQAAQVGVLDYANSQLVTATGSSQSATALPAGCYMARVANLGSSAVHVRGDDLAATTAAPGIPAGSVETVVVTATTRVIRLIGTSGNTYTITPYLTSSVSVADQP
jgi:hypothetical protein